MERLWKNFAVNNVLFGDIQRHLMNRSDEFFLRESAGLRTAAQKTWQKLPNLLQSFASLKQIWPIEDQKIPIL